MSDKCTAELTGDGTCFRLRRGAWFNDYPCAELDQWIQFYKQMKQDYPRSLDYYDDTIEALERLAASLPDQVRHPMRLATE